METIRLCEKRIADALLDKNSLRAIRRIQTNLSFAIAQLQAESVLTEANKVAKSIKFDNKKVSLSTHSRTIDNVLVYIFLKSLMALPEQTKAFRLGLIDKNGNLLREPKTPEENDSISNLDLVMAKLRLWLRPKLQNLSCLSWIRGVGNDMRLQNMLSNADTVAKQYVVRKLCDDLDKVLDKQ